MLIKINASLLATGRAFDARSEFLFIDGKNIVFGADMSSSVHADNKGKYILILGEGPTQRLDDTTLTAEAKYPINFTQSGKRFVLGLHYNGSNSFSFVNATKVHQFKAKTQKYKIMHCFGHVSKDFTVKSMKKQD